MIIILANWRRFVPKVGFPTHESEETPEEAYKNSTPLREEISWPQLKVNGARAHAGKCPLDQQMKIPGGKQPKIADWGEVEKVTYREPTEDYPCKRFNATGNMIDQFTELTDPVPTKTVN